ncbi:MAG: alpha/beta hydrolase [Pleurocapsa sp. CRU_1_2]|nr:alpha/beta hydrolase [Pleurocapsa sp. CRU_1_2]
MSAVTALCAFFPNLNMHPIENYLNELELWFLIGVVFLIGLAGLGAVYQQLAIARDRLKYPSRGKHINVDGYWLHFHDMGNGTPTVVIDSGAGGFSLEWMLVAPAVAKFTRVCTYDRAGLGRSQSNGKARTSQQCVNELRTLLAAAGLTPPYLLVGHSFGGMNVRLYTSQYPEEVVGMVLIDPGHEDFHLQCTPERQRKDRQELQLYFWGQIVSVLGLVRLLGSIGLLPMIQKFKSRRLTYTPELRALFTEFEAYWYQSQYCKTVYSELSNLKTSSEQVRTARLRLNIPLIILSRGGRLHLSSHIAEVDARNEEIWHKLQADLVNLSCESIHWIASHSDHHIHLDQPDLVVRAIYDVVKKVRQGRDA